MVSGVRTDFLLCQPVIARVFLFFLVSLSCAPLLAQPDSDKGGASVGGYFNAVPPPLSPLGSLPSGYLARIEQNSPEEIVQALLRAESLFRDGAALQIAEPLVFVLHGPEVAIFFRENYGKYKSVVDLAARLSALEVIDVRVCRTRMGVLGREDGALVPFVTTVPFGPAEVERLIDNEKFVYF